MTILERRLAQFFSVFLVAVVAVLTLPTPTASAALTDGYCDNNEVCVYRDINLGTPRSDFLYFYDDMSGCPDCHTFNYPSSCNNVYSFACLLNDHISSIDSWSDHRKVRFFENAHYDGVYETLPIYGRSNTVTYNDAYSSECWNDGGIPLSTDPDCTF